MKKVLVLGSTGFIGRNLVPKLLSHGCCVFSFSTQREVPWKEAKHLAGDIRELPKLKYLLKSRPDTVVSFVGLSGQAKSDKFPKQYFDVNVTAHVRLLELILEICPKSHFIWSSSRLEYGKPEYLPVDENHPMLPLSQYGLNKNIISMLCQVLKSKGLKSTVLRSSNPYGPHVRQKHKAYNIVNYFIDQAISDQELLVYGKGKQKRDYFYIGDFIDLLLMIINNTKSVNQVYNVGGGVGITLKNIAKEIVKITGKGSVRYVPWPRHEKRVETGDYVSDITKVTRDTGWKPQTKLNEGIKKTLKYFHDGNFL